MLPRLAWRGFPLTLQFYQKTPPVYQMCKQHLLSTPAHTVYISSRTLLLPCKPALHAAPCILNSRCGSRKFSSHMKKRKVQEEDDRKNLGLLRYDLLSLKNVPKPALYLGLGGLIPFVAPPVVMIASSCYYPELGYAQIAYGAAILSFLGGVRWGFAIPEGSPAKPDWMNLANSTVPAIFAWIALLFKDTPTESALLVIMGLGIALHYDLALLPTYPSWFKGLRAVLTFVAVLSLIATLTISGLYPHKTLVKGPPDF
ncbi:transmembrane protein 69 [Pelobates fuscus]|uniref:transmembrane protein 69 n=1 Tax=Pelobates fuscus TaxID=191477 RepID=UPI002FE4B6F1